MQIESNKYKNLFTCKLLLIVAFIYFSVPCWGARHTFVFLAFLGFANVYAMRVNLSVAIVAMVNHTAIDHLHNSSNLSEYFLGPTPSIQGKHNKICISGISIVDNDDTFRNEYSF